MRRDEINHPTRETKIRAHAASDIILQFAFLRVCLFSLLDYERCLILILVSLLRQIVVCELSWNLFALL